MLRRVRASEIFADVVFALVLLAFVISPVFGLIPSGTRGEALEIMTVAGMFAVVSLRRLLPLPALLFALVLAAVFVFGEAPVLPAAWVQVTVPLYTVGRYGSVRDRIVAAGTVVVGIGLAGYWFVMTGGLYGLNQLPRLAFILGGLTLLLTLSLLLGILVDVIARGRELARQRQEALERAEVEQERVDIARDMHDVVAHSLAVVVAQANGARYSLDPAQKDESLRQIADTASRALGDVRALLHRLRHVQVEGPSASVEQIPQLVDDIRSAGLGVDVVVHGTVPPLERAVDIAIYRIVQEALTNALRHGDRAVSASVAVNFGSVVDVQIRNALDRAPGPHGHGLLGMQERARIAGGVCKVGVEDGQFVVRAALPALQPVTA